jgi:hypothetical protein
MLSTELELLCTVVGMLYRVLECLLQSWKSCVHGRNAFQRVGIPIYGAGMLSTELEYACTELECFLEGWNAFDRVGIPLYRVEMISAVLECFLQG